MRVGDVLIILSRFRFWLVPEAFVITSRKSCTT